LITLSGGQIVMYSCVDVAVLVEVVTSDRPSPEHRLSTECGGI